MNKIKWGFIGCGDVTEVKSGPAFSKIENSEVVKVMRRDLVKAKDYAERHSIPAYSNDADDILTDPNIDAVYIATPPSTHAEYTIKAAQNKKHVYVEKPMAVNYNECKTMISACEENGVKLFVAYYRRELEYFRKVEQIIKDGLIGDVKLIDLKFWQAPSEKDIQKDSANWRVDSKIAGGGYFYDLASHQFDYLDLLFGEVKSVFGHYANQAGYYNTEDIVSASFQFDNKIIGSGSWCFTVDKSMEIDRTEIIGSKGRVAFSYFNQNPIEFIVDGDKEAISIDYPAHVQQNLIETVLGDLLGTGICRSTGVSGARTNWVLEQIVQ